MTVELKALVAENLRGSDGWMVVSYMLGTRGIGRWWSNGREFGHGRVLGKRGRTDGKGR